MPIKDEVIDYDLRDICFKNSTKIDANIQYYINSSDLPTWRDISKKVFSVNEVQKTSRENFHIN